MNTKTLNNLKPFLYGKLLGDANLEKPSYGRRQSRLKLEHSIKQKEYILHCYKKLHNFCNKPFDRKRKLIYKNKIRHYETCIVQSKRLPVFTELYNMWYKNIKTLPCDLEKFFTEETLAYWYMDDGYIHLKSRSSDINFCTQNFNVEDVDILVNLLNKKFNFDATKVCYTKNNKYIIRISKKDKVKKFKDLVRPYIITSMLYKIRDCN